MKEHSSIPRTQATATAATMAKSPAAIVVRLMLRCPHCKQKSLCVGKSTGDSRLCPSCGTRHAMR